MTQPIIAWLAAKEEYYTSFDGRWSVADTATVVQLAEEMVELLQEMVDSTECSCGYRQRCLHCRADIALYNHARALEER